MPRKEDKGPHTKVKSEAVTEMPIPVIITTRPMTPLSSIAVNTDSVMTMDTDSLVHLIQPNGGSSVSSIQNDMSGSHSDMEFAVLKDDILYNMHDHDLEVMSATEKFVPVTEEEQYFLQVGDLSTALSSNHSPLAHSLSVVSHSTSDSVEMIFDAVEDSPSTAFIPAVLDFQTCSFPNESPSKSSPTHVISNSNPGNSSLQNHSVSPALHLLGCPRLNQSGSADETCQCSDITAVNSPEHSGDCSLPAFGDSSKNISETQEVEDPLDLLTSLPGDAH